MVHEIVVEGPLAYPGGKNGMYRAVCSAGDWASGFDTEPEVRKDGQQHADAKNEPPEVAAVRQAALRLAVAQRSYKDARAALVATGWRQPNGLDAYDFAETMLTVFTENQQEAQS